MDEKSSAEYHQLGVHDMFKIGVGPSSSHTVGPMRAGKAFIDDLVQILQHSKKNLTKIKVELYGSLAATGKGHYTDKATLLGLCGYEPKTVPTEQLETIIDKVNNTGELETPAGKVKFQINEDLKFMPNIVLPYCVNGMKILATDDQEQKILSTIYYSVGGGFIMVEPENAQIYSLDENNLTEKSSPIKYPFTTGDQLLEICAKTGFTISEIVLENEKSIYSEEEINSYLEQVLQTMNECVKQGCSTSGTLPGGLHVRRRARDLFEQLCDRKHNVEGCARYNNFDEYGWAGTNADPLMAMDWVNLFALAVNEENAAGHRIVTAPTNGAAGIIPAVIGYYKMFVPKADMQGCKDFLLAATAIGSIIKINASIAGAEVGCQGEVGSAAAMAAAGLAQVFGGTAEQIEYAAEIAMEHNLGLTCDPVGGLVQIPCIERNAIASIKAINAARMALWSDGRHNVSLDVVIETMRQTGKDMHSKYKETSEGGLAVNVVEC